MTGIQACAGDSETWSNVKKGEPYPKAAVATSRYPFYAFKDAKNQAFVKKHREMTDLWPSYGALNQYTIIYAIKAGIEKAGAVDTEKIITALEGMTLETMVGKVPIRAYDHQAMMPTWYGTMDFNDELGFPYLGDIKAVGEEAYHTIAQIKAIRAAKK